MSNMTNKQFRVVACLFIVAMAITIGISTMLVLQGLVIQNYEMALCAGILLITAGGWLIIINKLCD